MSGNNIPFFEVGAGARVENGEYIRVTPARQSRLGFVWNMAPITVPDWEATLVFRAHGQPALGGDGLALWLVAEPKLLGQVYGATDYWDGLMLAVDTFNNDGTGDFPAVTAVLNDGSLSFDVSTDGLSQALAHCAAPVRNTENWVTMRVTYQQRALSVQIDAKGDGTFSQCFAVNDVDLPLDYYFGVTAGTGDLADAHDVSSFSVRTLTPADSNIEAIRMRNRQLHDHSNMADHSIVAMDDNAFQNEVMRMLNQIHTSINQVEIGQVALGNQLVGMAEGRGAGGSAQDAVASGSGGTLPISELNQIASTQATILTRLSDVVSARNAPSLVRLAESLNKLESTVGGRGGVSGGVGGGDDVRNLVESVRADVKLALKTTLADALAAGGASSSGGWLGSLLTASLSACLGGLVVWYTMRASRHSAYKLP